MNDQTWYYIDSAGAQQGPITIPELQALAANGGVINETQVWTDALGEQWIPAANVEGLFAPTPVATPATPTPASPQKLATPPVSAATSTPAAPATPPADDAPADPATPATPAFQGAPVPMLKAAPSTVRTPAKVTDIIEEQDIQQPLLAPTTPMMPSTPTTQAVTGVPVPKSLLVQEQAPAQQNASDPYESPVTDPQDPQPLADGIYPATIKKGGSMGLWSMLVVGGILCIALGMMVAGMFSQDLGAPAESSREMMGLGLVLLGYACLLFSGILTYIYLYRAWKCLQPGGATISPGAAVGFLFIPLFNIYWLFKAIGGLPRQWNLITSSFANTKNAPRLTIGAFVCMLLIPIIGQIIWLSQITKGLNFMAALHFQQSRPSGSALSGLASRANFQ